MTCFSWKAWSESHLERSWPLQAMALILGICLAQQAAAARVLTQAVAPAVSAVPSVNVAPSPAIAYLGNLAAGALGLFNLFNASQVSTASRSKIVCKT